MTDRSPDHAAVTETAAVIARDLTGGPAAAVLRSAMGRRSFLRVVTLLGTGSVGAACSWGSAASGPNSAAAGSVLQPGSGDLSADHYLASTPDQVLWGYVPTTSAMPVARMRSGETIMINALSHEGILEDQGRDPVAWFGGQGVARTDVLEDAVAVAAGYSRTPRNFDVDGPHVVTGPVFVEGAQPGDVLKIETLAAVPRVPYGVVSSRHGKGALARTVDGGAPSGITLAEVMPPVTTDGRATKDPLRYGNVSTFTAVEGGMAVMRYGRAAVRFPLKPFLGMMGVAFTSAPGLTSPEANSVPPTLGGGNIDISLLGPGSTFYLPVFAEGALFYVGDPHMAMRRRGRAHRHGGLPPGHLPAHGVQEGVRRRPVGGLPLPVRGDRGPVDPHWTVRSRRRSRGSADRPWGRDASGRGQCLGLPADRPEHGPRRRLRISVRSGRLPRFPGGRQDRRRARLDREVALRLSGSGQPPALP